MVVRSRPLRMLRDIQLNRVAAGRYVTSGDSAGLMITPSEFAEAPTD
jgi:hypothetical protein